MGPPVVNLNHTHKKKKKSENYSFLLVSLLSRVFLTGTGSWQTALLEFWVLSCLAAVCPEEISKRRLNDSALCQALQCTGYHCWCCHMLSIVWLGIKVLVISFLPFIVVEENPNYRRWNSFHVERFFCLDPDIFNDSQAIQTPSPVCYFPLSWCVFLDASLRSVWTLAFFLWYLWLILKPWWLALMSLL